LSGFVWNILNVYNSTVIAALGVRQFPTMNMKLKTLIANTYLICPSFFL